MKICALLVPKEMKHEHSATLKALSDEELDATITAVREMLEERGGDVIEGTAEPAALPAPADVEPPKRKANRLMIEADNGAIVVWENPNQVGSQIHFNIQSNLPNPGAGWHVVGMGQTTENAFTSSGTILSSISTRSPIPIQTRESIGT